MFINREEFVKELVCPRVHQLEDQVEDRGFGLVEAFRQREEDAAVGDLDDLRSARPTLLRKPSSSSLGWSQST